MLLILWIFLSVRQISQCFFTYHIQLSELLVQKILSLKLETGLEGQRNVYLFLEGIQCSEVNAVSIWTQLIQRTSVKDHRQRGFMSPVFHETHRNK